MTSTQKVIKNIAIILGVLLIIFIISTMFYGVKFILNIFAEEDVIINMNEFEIKSQINSLDVDIASASLIIKTGDNFKVETNNKNVNINENNGCLYIKEKKHNWFNSNNDSKIIIYINENIYFNDVSIEAGAGNISVDNLTVDNLNLTLGAGKLVVNNLDVNKKTVIDGGAGQIEILNSVLNDLDFDIGVGKVILESAINGDSDIDAGVGELNLTILGASTDYRILANKGIGSFKIMDDTIGDNQIYGDGKNKIEIDGGVGNINIDFKEKNSLDASKTYIRTYKIISKVKANNSTSYYLTLQDYNGIIDTVLIDNLSEDLLVDKYYEFKFIKDNNNYVEDNIDSIFSNLSIDSISEVDKFHDDQANDI